MAIAPELRAQILRFYQAELWRVGTIARQLHVHRDTVRQVLAQSCVLRTQLTPRPSQADAYLAFILQTLTKFPTLTASRLYVMVRERGYLGGADYFRHFVARHRPRPVAKTYLRLRTLPGEQAQCDWAHCGHLIVGRAKRPLMAFVMVLSYSRRIFLRFSLNARMDSFLRGHVLALEEWGGVPRVPMVGETSDCHVHGQQLPHDGSDRLAGTAALLPSIDAGRMTARGRRRPLTRAD